MTMQFTVLGCSGGIGSGRHTTCFRVNHDVLIDVGTGITTLDFAAMQQIDHVFITHAHLDHVLGLPLLLDSVGERRDKPVVVHALPEVLDILSTHLFNWHLWPDFREIPSKSSPWLRFEPLTLGMPYRLGAHVFTPLPVTHTVPACAYQIASSKGSLVFSGDTTHSPALLAALNAIPDLAHLIIEVSFENALVEVAQASKHHWPDSLADELRGLRGSPRIWITHLKPGNEAAIMDELHAAMPQSRLAALEQGQTISI